MKHKHIETPWGPSQSQHEHAPGIVFHSTASHGGYHLSTERWKDFTAIQPFDKWPASWLEEDCDACLVYLRWPELATDEQIHDAIGMARAVASWHGNEEGRWRLLVVWIEQRPELLARAQAHAEAVKYLWQRGSMSTMNHMDYPTKRYYTDAELDQLSKAPASLRGDSGSTIRRSDYSDSVAADLCAFDDNRERFDGFGFGDEQ